MEKESVNKEYATGLRRLAGKIINRETIMYGIWGLVTSFWNYGIFYILNLINIDYKISNIIALLSTKILAYFVNKLFVFKNHCSSWRQVLAEVVRFTLSRAATMVLDYFLLILFTEVLFISPSIGKAITTIFVVVVNYFLGKYLVYKTKIGKDENLNNEASNSDTML